MKTSTSVAEDLGVDALVDAVAAHAHTAGARDALRRILLAPTSDAAALRARAADLEWLTDEARSRELGEALRRAAEHEPDLEWLARADDDLDDEARQTLDAPYFQTLGLLNSRAAWPLLGANTSYVTLAAPAAAAASPVAYLLAPLLMLRRRLGVRMGLFAYAQLMYHLLRASQDVLVITAGRATAVLLQLASLGVFCFVYAQTVATTWNHASLVAGAARAIVDRVAGACAADETGIGRHAGIARRWGAPDAQASTGVDPAAALRRFRRWDPRCGRALAEFRRRDAARVRGFLRCVHAVDAVAALAKWRAQNGLPLAQIGGPGVLLRGAWHPECDAPVKNDAALAAGGARESGMLVRGANASGKSTFLRAVGLATLMAHTVRVVCADAAAVRPLAHLHTHMRVADDAGANLSRFQAEMRSVEAMRAAAAGGGPCLVLCDEIFASTNVRKAGACLSALVRELSANEACMAAIATHHECDGGAFREFRASGMRIAAAQEP